MTGEKVRFYRGFRVFNIFHRIYYLILLYTFYTFYASTRAEKEKIFFRRGKVRVLKTSARGGHYLSFKKTKDIKDKCR